MPYMEHMGMSTLPSPFPIHADLRAKSIAGAAEGFTSRTPRLAGLALAVVPWCQRGPRPWGFHGLELRVVGFQGWGKWIKVLENKVGPEKRKKHLQYFFGRA